MHPAPQAISFLRQKKLGEAAKALNNLLSCEAALPSAAPAQWGEREELQDLFSAYLSQVGGVGPSLLASLAPSLAFCSPVGRECHREAALRGGVFEG